MVLGAPRGLDRPQEEHWARETLERQHSSTRAVGQTRHTQDSQGQILASAFKSKSFELSALAWQVSEEGRQWFARPTSLGPA